MHLNKEYVRGDELDIDLLFKVSPLDEEIQEELGLVSSYLEEMKQVLQSKSEPEADIGSICKSPYLCEFKTHCWKNVGNNSIHMLSRINDKKRAELIERGAEEITDIPEDYKLIDAITNTNSDVSVKLFKNVKLIKDFKLGSERITSFRIK